MALAAITVVLAALTAYPLCDMVFACGCTWAFAGGEAHCDIHTPGPPDCPVCTRPPVTAVFSAALLAAWGAVVWGVAGLVARLRAPAPPGA